MFKKIMTAGVAVLGLVLTMQASAHHSRDNHRNHKPSKPVFSVNKAQSIQANLIHRGVKNRSLTRFEEKKLRQEQNIIAHLERKYRHNGLQRWERNTLETRLKSSAKRIKSFMNNREYRHVRHHKKPRHHKHTSHHRSNNGTATLWIHR